MALSARDLSKLNQIISIAQAIIAKADSKPEQKPTKAKTTSKRTRRSGKDLIEFRKMLKAERKRGVGVAELAKRHGVSTAYIYTL